MIDAIDEMISYHGGQDEFIRRAEEHDKKALSIATPDQDRAKQRLRGTKEKNKIQRYQKYSKQLVESGYRFPSERLSGYGARMLIQKVGSLKAREIPDLLIHGLHMTIDAKTLEEFHRIRDIRNSIAHGSSTSLSLREVADMNETLRKLAHSFDKHLNEHFLISEDYI